MAESGWNLTAHGKRGQKIRAISGKHFQAIAFDDSAERAVTAFLSARADGVGYRHKEESG